LVALEEESTKVNRWVLSFGGWWSSMGWWSTGDLHNMAPADVTLANLCYWASIQTIKKSNLNGVQNLGD